MTISMPNMLALENAIIAQANGTGSSSAVWSSLSAGTYGSAFAASNVAALNVGVAAVVAAIGDPSVASASQIRSAGNSIFVCDLCIVMASSSVTPAWIFNVAAAAV